MRNIWSLRAWKGPEYARTSRADSHQPRCDLRAGIHHLVTPPAMKVSGRVLSSRNLGSITGPQSQPITHRSRPQGKGGRGKRSSLRSVCYSLEVFVRERACDKKRRRMARMRLGDLRSYMVRERILAHSEDRLDENGYNERDEVEPSDGQRTTSCRRRLKETR